MKKILLRLLPPLISWSVFLYVIFATPYPESLTQASLLQFISFFGSLTISIILTVHLLIKNLLVNLLISFGIIILLILKALDSLNIVTSIITILAVGLFISYFRNSKQTLTSPPDMPKLTRIRK